MIEPHWRLLSNKNLAAEMLGITARTLPTIDEWKSRKTESSWAIDFQRARRRVSIDAETKQFVAFVSENTVTQQ